MRDVECSQAVRMFISIRIILLSLVFGNVYSIQRYSEIDINPCNRILYC